MDTVVSVRVYRSEERILMRKWIRKGGLCKVKLNVKIMGLDNSFMYLSSGCIVRQE